MSPLQEVLELAVNACDERLRQRTRQGAVLVSLEELGVYDVDSLNAMLSHDFACVKQSMSAAAPPAFAAVLKESVLKMAYSQRGGREARWTWAECPLVSPPPSPPISDVSCTSKSQQVPARPQKVSAWSKLTQHKRTMAQLQGLHGRLARSDTSRTLVASGARDARKALEDFADIHRAHYSLVDAILYGSFIDFAVMLRCTSLGSSLIRTVVRHGGPEQIRFLLRLAQFDSDSNGTIDDAEWDEYKKVANILVADCVAMCNNTAVIGALLLGLTHLITVGRPIPYTISEESAEVFGPWLLWLAYTCNAVAECSAFFTLCMAVITRNNITNVLPTIELKLDLLRTTHSLSYLGVSLIITLWFFLLSSIFGTLVASPSIGAVGCGCFGLALVLCMGIIAPVRYVALLLLHEETKRYLDTKSFVSKKRSSTNGPSQCRQNVIDVVNAAVSSIPECSPAIPE